jgi:hypothetical protein
MPFKKELLTCSYFPVAGAPFGDILERVFFAPIDENSDYPIHGPNVIRFTKALLESEFEAPGLLRREEVDRTKFLYRHSYRDIMNALEAGGDDEERRVKELLMIAALYHDIGKSIRRSNHPQIGANLIRTFVAGEQTKLVDALAHEGESQSSESKHNRFSLISSIIQHHDKFGVVSTGEGGLPIFSDVLYFNSGMKTIPGVVKNITSVMLLNLADIAAVCTAPRDVILEVKKLANEVGRMRGLLATLSSATDAATAAAAGIVTQDNPSSAGSQMNGEGPILEELCRRVATPSYCLGLNYSKMNNVLDDWRTIVAAITDDRVRGDRVELKLRLLDLERNPSRAIRRILRLLRESAEVSGAAALARFVTPTTVESVLVGTLGANQFQTFAEQLSTVVKLDYGLAFFRAVLCGCVRQRLDVGDQGPWNRLSPQEQVKLAGMDEADLSTLADRITILFVRVVASLVSRYVGVLSYTPSNPRRFGFQMRDLTSDDRTRGAIIGLLLRQEKEPIALNWISDEVTIWSMD